MQPDEALPLDALIGKLFISRRDVKAIQKSDGAYNPVLSKWTRADVQAHLAGQKTYGHYVLDQESKCKFFCYDMDFNKESRLVFRSTDQESRDWLILQMRCLASALSFRIERLLKIPAVVLFSGNKGLHVYGLTGHAPALHVQNAGRLVLDSFVGPDGVKQFDNYRGDVFFRHCWYPEIEIELFPVQTQIEQDEDGKWQFGNLLRLPLGIHRKSGKESFFVHQKAQLYELLPDDPLETLNLGSMRHFPLSDRG